ncbi:MAG: lytic murein transglycosylase [Candidatus Latescibacteria bacterium]|nr:lytic murein transglycosylase [Candidatus Latescibacterota bacterium]
MRIAYLVIAFFTGSLSTTVEADSHPPFADWLAQLRQEALDQGISAATLDAAFKDLQPVQRVLELDRNQPEFKSTLDDYLRRVVSAGRVEKGRRLWAENRAQLQEIGQRYGVQPRFLVALWGIESSYGSYMGKMPVVSSLATLAHDPRRAKFFRAELLAALHILDEGHTSLDKMVGSWAGAIGQVQFLPTLFRRYAVDYDGDGRRDIWGTRVDAWASAAAFLVDSGWSDEQTWGRRVQLPEGFDKDLIGLKVRRDLSQWQELGVRRADGRDLPKRSLEASLVEPRNGGGQVFMVYGNYRVLLKWNRSNAFAIAVGQLAGRLAE